MFRLMTRTSKWASKHNINNDELFQALEELQEGKYEANLGGNLYKKRVRFVGRGKRGSGRTIVCYKKGDRAIFIHGFAKNEKSSLSKKELHALKEFAKLLFSLTSKQLVIAIQKGDFVEVQK